MRINSHLHKALKKDAKYDRMIFIDLNLPPHEGAAVRSEWAKQAGDQIARRQDAMAERGNGVSAYLVLTNQPYHYVEDEVWTQRGLILGSSINVPNFLKGAPASTDAPEAAEWSDNFRAKHPELAELIFSLQNESAIPTEFP